MKQRHTQSGFTIMEMIVYGAILSLFLIVLTSLFSTILETQLGAEATSAIVQDGKFMELKFAYDMTRATDIVEPVALGDSSTSLQLVIDGETHTYAVTDGTLYSTNTNGSDAVSSMGVRVSDIEFLRLGNIDGKHSIRLSFTLTSTTQRVSGPETRNFQTTVATR